MGAFKLFDECVTKFLADRSTPLEKAEVRNNKNIHEEDRNMN